MAKNKNKNLQSPDAQVLPLSPLLSKCQWVFIFCGASIVTFGFFVLSKADPFAQNWAGRASPFLILSGYVLIGLTLWRVR